MQFNQSANFKKVILIK